MLTYTPTPKRPVQPTREYPWLLLLLAFAWLWPGVFSHDLWKPSEPELYTTISETPLGSWLPMLFGEANFQAAPLYVQTAQLCQRLLSPWAADAYSAARFASVFYTSLGLLGSGMAGYRFLGRHYGRSVVLILIGSAGLLPIAHFMDSQSLLFAGIGLAMWGYAVAHRQAILAALLIALASVFLMQSAGILIAAAPLLTGWLLWLTSAQWRSNRILITLVCATLTALPLASLHKTSLPEANKTSENSYEELMQALLPYITANQENWQQEITLNRHGARKILMCHGSRLPDSGKRGRNGHVIVIDDITEFLHAQRNAAWEEVAKRLAHEIKNPLTPIRLQSERLQKRLADKLADENDQQILAKATGTIIDQVEAMQQIVADFSQIAKPLETRRQNLQLNPLLRQIAELYREQHLTLDLHDPLGDISADPVHLRQILINLMKNAIEATQNQDAPQIRWHTSQHNGQITLDIEDNGPGFADLNKDPFEPYVTNKPKGTGLGLAIVKKIVHEHDGTISAGHSRDLGGAKITITLPLTTTSTTP